MDLLILFLTFLRIGALTFGGGYAMLPLIESEVIAHGWMTLEELLNLVAVSESTPGPLAVNAATCVGAQVAGVPGAFFATLGVVLPSFVIILIAAKFYAAFRHNRAVEGCMQGLRPAVVGMIAAAALSIGKTVFFPSGISLSAWQNQAIPMAVSAGIFALCMFLSYRKIHPIFIILAAAAIGLGTGFLGVWNI